VTRVLVTGAHGLIGSWLVKALLARGDAVTVLARRDRPHSPLELEGTIGQTAVVRGDVTDGPLLQRALADHRIELVFHLAGQAIAGSAGPDAADTFRINVAGTWAVLEACRAASSPRLVVASSEQVYGPAPVLPCTEHSPLRPADAYAASKAAADVIARGYAAAHALPIAVARLGNVYGGGDMNPSRLVPAAVWATLAGRRPQIRSAPTDRRDFLHVEDAVAAYLAIADLLADADGPAGAAFNAGSGRRPSVSQIISQVRAAAGLGDADALHEQAAGDPASVDHSRLSALTGWQPCVDLADGIRRTLAWYRRYAPAPPPTTAGPTS
jgi:CDP-glucose 4,6-dehydratase